MTINDSENYMDLSEAFRMYAEGLAAMMTALKIDAWGGSCDRFVVDGLGEMRTSIAESMVYLAKHGIRVLKLD